MEAVIPNGKSLIEMAEACERRAREVASDGDSAQLRLIARQLKETT
jgi:hypothetical protein